MNNALAYRIGFDDGLGGEVCLPFEGWSELADIFAYLRGYYAGKKRKNFLENWVLTHGQK